MQVWEHARLANPPAKYYLKVEMLKDAHDLPTRIDFGSFGHLSHKELVKELAEKDLSRNDLCLMAIGLQTTRRVVLGLGTESASEKILGEHEDDIEDFAGQTPCEESFATTRP